MRKGTKEEKEGFTFDGTRNTLIDMARPDPQMRYDRVLWRGAVRKVLQQQQQQQQQGKGSMATAAGGRMDAERCAVGGDGAGGGGLVSQ